MSPIPLALYAFMVYALRIMAEAWTILSDKYNDWASTSVARFPADFELSVPSARNLVLLALMANAGKECSYDDLLETISASGSVEGTLPKDNLRVAIQDLRSKLTATKFHLRTDRRGREAVLQLLDQEVGGQVRKGVPPGKTYDVLRQLEAAPAAASQIAWDLIRTRAIHHAQHYVLPRSASYWTTYSADETFARASFERSAYERLFTEWLSKQTGKGICLLGLNIGGEGDAELNILRDLIDRFDVVHYLAVDLSGQLLTDHSVYLNHQFGTEIQSGRLVCAVKAATFEDPLRAATAVAEVRADMTKRHPELGTFFSEDYPIFCSYLSNYIGNRSRPQCEWDVFNSVLSVFPVNPGHAFFVGFASLMPATDASQVDPDKAEQYPRSWFDFLTQTPRELLYNTGSLTSGQNPENGVEFKVPPEKEFQGEFGRSDEEGKRFLLDVQKYEGAGPIRGHSYKFSYRTNNWLATDYSGQSFVLDKGSDISLYQIVKFDPKTLAQYLDQMGLRVIPNPPERSSTRLTSGKFDSDQWAESKQVGEDIYEHRYQLLAAFDTIKESLNDNNV